MTMTIPMTSETMPGGTGKIYLTDGGLETTMIFHEGFDLPHFAAFDLLRTEEGRNALEAYYNRYMDIAEKSSCGFILEAPTWRANSDWGQLLGLSQGDLDKINKDAMVFLRELRDRRSPSYRDILISGCIGPRGDGYSVEELMTADAAKSYHLPQIHSLADSGVDLVTALTMTNTSEAVGLAMAAMACDVPVVISFTVETDGTLPSGEQLADAIRFVDQATNNYPVYYMINCAHPVHFSHLLNGGNVWIQRIRGIRGNASKCSHEELDNAEELDAGNPDELGAEYRAIRQACPNIVVLGGCCGTDHRHVEAIAHSCAA